MPIENSKKMEQAFQSIKFSRSFRIGAESITEEQEYYKQLTLILKTMGCQFCKINMMTPKNGARGLFSANSIKKGEHIMTIPLSAALETIPFEKLTLPNTPLHQSHERMFNTSITTGNDLFDFIKLNDMQTQEHYKAYIKLLPNHFSNSPIFFNQHFLDNTGFGQHTLHIIDQLKIDYITLIAESRLNLPIDTFLWAFFNMQSRCFNFKDKHYMVPVLDLANHTNKSPNCNLRFDPAMDKILFIANQDISQETELTYSYKANLCPIRTLLYYNMMPEDILLQHHEKVYFFVEKNRYDFGVACAQSIATFCQQQTLSLNELHHKLQEAITARQVNEICSLEQASNSWEKKVIQFIYQQEIRAYSKACHLLEQLKKLGINISSITHDHIEQLL